MTIRRATTTTAGLTLLVLLLAAGSARAQACNGDETPMDCFTRLWNELGEENDTQAARAERAEAAVEAAVAGELADHLSSALPAALIDGSLKDFLPLLIGSVGLGALNEDDGALSLAVDPLRPFGLPGSGAFLLAATAFDPEPYAPLIAAQPSDRRGSVRDALSEELEDFDDVSLSLAWNHRSRRFGRWMRGHPDVQALFGEIGDMAAPPDSDRSRIELALVLHTAGSASGKDVEKLRFDAIRDEMSPETAEVIERAVVEAAMADAAIDRRLRQLRELYRLGLFADLFNNQPQLHVELGQRFRGGAAGPDAVSGELTYEHGFVNVNTLRGACGGTIDLDCYVSYASERDRQIARAPRLTLSLEYSETDAFELALAEPELSFGAPAAEVTVASLTYGQYFRAFDPATRESRFELQADYENATGDPARNDRFVATATWIQELADDTSVSLGLVWANRPEYLGEVDEELSARIGLRYEIDRNGS